MTFQELKLVVLDAHEARSRVGRALAEHFPEGSTIVVRVEGEDTEWDVEDVDLDRLRIKAHREIGDATPLQASFGVSDLVGPGQKWR